MVTAPAGQSEETRGARPGDPAAARVPGSPVDEALRLLATIREAPRPVRVMELARRLGIPRSTATRLVQRLENHGLIVREMGGYSAARPAGEEEMRFAVEALQRTACPLLLDLYGEIQAHRGSVGARRRHPALSQLAPRSYRFFARALTAPCGLSQSAAGRVLLACADHGLRVSGPASHCDSLNAVREKGLALCDIAVPVAVKTAAVAVRASVAGWQLRQS